MTSDSNLETSFERLSLPVSEPFGISRGVTRETENVVVRIGDGEHVGYGAAAPSAYYGETPGTVEGVLPDLLEIVEAVDDAHAVGLVHRRMDALVKRNPAAKAAVDVALHDLAAKRVGLPLYRHLGLDPTGVRTSSVTVSLSDPDRMRERAMEAVEAGYDCLKVKLGSDPDRDRETLEAVREAAPRATIRVDANAAWTAKEAVAKSEWLKAAGVEFVEQPTPAGESEGHRHVHARGALPVAVDESCERASDVPPIADRADVVVVKLMKCGGIAPALLQIHAARAHGLEVMLGCMLETNLSIAAAAHLVPLSDYVDLDGSLLLESDPYDGLPIPGGRLDPTTFEQPGTGARPAEGEGAGGGGT
jgi:L-alanine-DL-glutamate epimerase-like enolase superfamily enzyme